MTSTQIAPFLRRARPRTALTCGVAATLLAVALITLVPAGWGWTWADPATELAWYLSGLDDATTRLQLLGNLVLLVPTAALAAARWPVLRRPAALLPACLVLAAGIETLQYLLPLGRVVSLVDVGLNTLGALPVLVAAALLRARPRGGAGFSGQA
ncbi:VanZ family protein [Geodermatophilaceae bacterium NBWT11]|nr:VanZ family protein [Geodermatophilaceae bacterium NBWT11]